MNFIYELDTLESNALQVALSSMIYKCNHEGNNAVACVHANLLTKIRMEREQQTKEFSKQVRKKVDSGR